EPARCQILRRDDQAAGKPGRDAARPVQPEGRIVARPALGSRSSDGGRGGDEIPRCTANQGATRGVFPDSGAGNVTASSRQPRGAFSRARTNARGWRVRLTRQPPMLPCIEWFTPVL